MATRINKPYYSTAEAARSLGLSVEEFQKLLRRHIVEREDDLDHLEVAVLHASDLLVLKLLCGMPVGDAVDKPQVITRK